MEIKELKKIKVLIADDIMILRQGLKAVLEQDDDIEVVALAENGKIAFEMSEKYIPDVVLMDMRMPEFDGEYGIRHIKDELPQIKVLVLTTFDDEETINKALESGADGYILNRIGSRVIASEPGVGNIKFIKDGKELNVYVLVVDSITGTKTTCNFDKENFAYTYLLKYKNMLLNKNIPYITQTKLFIYIKSLYFVHSFLCYFKPYLFLIINITFIIYNLKVLGYFHYY